MQIGRKIREARRSAGLTQESLADKCGYPNQSRISGYETGEREPSFADLELIASALGLSSAAELIGKPVEDVPSDYQMLSDRIPVIGWDKMQEWSASPETFRATDSQEWLTSPFPHSKHAVYLRVIGDSMWPDYSEGDYILVDPAVNSRHGNDVVVKTTDNRFLLKRLQITPEGTYLLAVNTDHPNRKIEAHEHSVICGVVAFSMKRRL